MQDSHSGLARGSVTQVRATACLVYAVDCDVGNGRELGCRHLVAVVHFQAAFCLDFQNMSCFSDTVETLLVSTAGDFGLEHVEDTELTVEALQSLAN